MLHCPFCKRTLTEDMIICPYCAFSVTETRPNQVTKIKMGSFSDSIMEHDAQVIMRSNGRILWEGHIGETAHILFYQSAVVEIHYLCGGTCNGRIDPLKSTSYHVFPQHTPVGITLTFQAVQSPPFPE